MRNTLYELSGDTAGFAESQQFLDIKQSAQAHLLTRIEEEGQGLITKPRNAVQQFVLTEVDAFIRSRRVPINDMETRVIADALFKDLVGLGPLEDLLLDPNIEDILCNGPKEIYVSRGGVLERSATRFTDSTHLLRIVRRILAPLGRRLDESTPMVDARLHDGGRLNAIIEPLALEGPVVSIRKFRKDPMTPKELVELGTMNQQVYDLLSAAVSNRCNIIISGGTSSGKTSLLNALANFIGETERIITIEDTAELKLHHEHVVRLESRPGGFEGSGEVTPRDLMRNSLRMRPDRVILGEVRGGEVLELLQAMGTGHDGSMGTIHANSPRECLYRMEMLAGFAGFQGSESSLRRMVSSAVDFIVQIGRLANGKRRILSVTEITGFGDNIVSMQEMFRHETVIGPDGKEYDRWQGLGVPPHSPKLAALRQMPQAGKGHIHV